MVVRASLGAPVAAHSAPTLVQWPQTATLMTGVLRMSDVVFVVLTVAFFAVAALVVKGVERL